MKLNTRNTILVGYLLTILMISFFAFYANRDIRKVRFESRQAANIVESLGTIEAILDDVQSIESGFRGYVSTGDSAFLADYDRGFSEIGKDTLRLKALEAHFPEMRVEYKKLLRLVSEKLRYAVEVVRIRASSGFLPAAAKLGTGEGRLLMDSVRNSVHRIEEEDRRLLALENQERQHAATSTSRLFNIMAIVFLFLLSFLFWLLYQSVGFQEKNERQIAYLANLTENTTDAIISTDAEGRVISWNRAAERIYGFSREEALGKFAPDLTQSGITPSEVAEMRRILLDKQELNREVKQMDREGRVVYTLMSTTALRDSGGDVTGFVSVLKDITERKILEEKLKLFNQELSRQVDEKTASLLRLNEQLARSNRDLEQFAYVASHDLQEPLRTIKSFLQLIEKKYNDQLDEQGREYIAFAVNGALRMKNLVADLLNFSRLGTRGLRYEQVDLHILVHQVLHHLEKLVTETRANVIVGDLPVLRCDRSQIELVFQNLIINALKYRQPDHDPIVEIGYREQRGFYEIYVKDSGIGIDPADHGIIFQLFQRLHTREEYPGAGIGLAICKKIVELHEGNMRVESGRNKGATFFFTLPRV
jgi:PAS domain S-box-containing protein